MTIQEQKPKGNGPLNFKRLNSWAFPSSQSKFKFNLFYDSFKCICIVLQMTNLLDEKLKASWQPISILITDSDNKKIAIF